MDTKDGRRFPSRPAGVLEFRDLVDEKEANRRVKPTFRKR
jgi:hypothetical protein